MKHLIAIAALICLPMIAVAEATTTVTPLLSKALADAEGREVTMLEVRYAPGAVDPIHRHDAQVFVYVLEGEIVMQVRGGAETRLKAGQTFYETPTDVHVVGRNASSSKPARFLAFFVKQKDAAILTPTQ